MSNVTLERRLTEWTCVDASDIDGQVNRPSEREATESNDPQQLSVGP